MRWLRTPVSPCARTQTDANRPRRSAKRVQTSQANRPILYAFSQDVKYELVTAAICKKETRSRAPRTACAAGRNGGFNRASGLVRRARHDPAALAARTIPPLRHPALPRPVFRFLTRPRRPRMPLRPSIGGALRKASSPPLSITPGVGYEKGRARCFLSGASAVSLRFSPRKAVAFQTGRGNGEPASSLPARQTRFDKRRGPQSGLSDCEKTPGEFERAAALSNTHRTRRRVRRVREDCCGRESHFPEKKPFLAVFAHGNRIDFSENWRERSWRGSKLPRPPACQTSEEARNRASSVRRQPPSPRLTGKGPAPPAYSSSSDSSSSISSSPSAPCSSSTFSRPALNSSRIFCSISSHTSGWFLRKMRTLSRPCPMRSPP